MLVSSCSSIFASLKRDSAMLEHAETPSNHVCSYCSSPGLPHLSNHDPPGAQQVSLPDRLSVPHFLQALGSGVPGFIGSRVEG